MKIQALLLALASTLLVPSAPQVGRVAKLNGPLPRPTVASLQEARLAPEGGCAVLRSDFQVDEEFELFSVPTDGSAVLLRLNNPLPAGGDVGSFAIAPGRRLVVYEAEQRTDGVHELYSVPLDRSHPPVRLNRTPVPGARGMNFFRLGEGGARVAYIAELDQSYVGELYSTAVEHFASDTKLSGPMVENGDVIDFALTADCSRAVYLADQDTDEKFELYAVGPGLARVKLSGALIFRGDVAAATNGAAFLISPDGTRVVYRADHEFDERFALFTVPIDSSLPPVQLNLPLASGERVTHFLIDPGSRRVVFGVYRDFEPAGRLYCAPIDGSAPPWLLSPVAYSSTLQIDPDGARAVFRIQPQGLVSVLLDGSSPTVRLDPPPYEGEVLSFRLRADAAGVVFRSRRSSVTALAAVPIDGSSPPMTLSLLAVDTGNDYAILPDSSGVLFVGQRVTDGPVELLSIPIDGSSPPLALSGPLVEGGRVNSFQLDADGCEVLYRATQVLPTVNEAFAVLADGSAPAVRVNPPLPPGPTVGDVSAIFRISSDGARVVFAADQEVDDLFELFSVPVNAHSAPVKLSEGREVAGFEVTPDGTRVLQFSLAPYYPRWGDLFVGPLHGRQPPTRLASLEVPGEGFLWISILISPDSSRAVCQLTGWSMPQPLRGPIVSVPIAGSAPAVTLSGPGARAFSITPDSGRAVYVESNRLYSRPLDGSGPAVDLSGPLVAGGDVSTVRVTPNSKQVVYIADQETPGLYELYGAPIDGSAAPWRLSGPAAGIGTSHFVLTPDSSWVVFVQETPAGARLQACRTSGGGDLVQLAVLESTGSHANPRLAAKGRVVYEDLPPSPGERLLLSVPIDGSLKPILLSERAGSFVLAPDGLRAVYSSSVGVFSVPADGSAAPIRLSRGPVPGYDLAVSADSSLVAFRVGGGDLFRAPLDGSARAIRVNTKLVEGGRVDSFLLTADGSTIVYRADQEEDEAYELFAGHHFGYRLPASEPPR